MLDKSRLRIAIQKSGRLSKESWDLLIRCGIRVSCQDQGLIAIAKNMPIDILRVRDDDIPGLIFDGVVDLGIIGANVLEEEVLKREKTGLNKEYNLLRKLDFGDCRLSIAVPLDINYVNLSSIENFRIATSYPFLLNKFMQDNKISYDNCLLTGSVEVAPRAGLSDAIFDLVSTGSTLEANGLKEVEVVYNSKACFIKRINDNFIDDNKIILINKILDRINGVILARESKYIMMHAPKDSLDDIVKLLPGIEVPTILPLANKKDFVALHMVSQENLFWDTMEKLKQAGASSILVLPIEKMME